MFRRMSMLNLIRSDYNTVDGRRFSNTIAPSTDAGSQILMHRRNNIRH